MSPGQQQLFNVTCRSSGGLPTRRPGLLRLCLSWRLLHPRSQPDGDDKGAGLGGAGGGGLEGEEEETDATAVSSHVLGLSWRSPLAEPRLYRETGLRAAAALAAAPPGAALLREEEEELQEAQEPDTEATAEIMRLLLQEVRRWAEDGGPSYGIWQRPPGLVEGSQVQKPPPPPPLPSPLLSSPLLSSPFLPWPLPSPPLLLPLLTSLSPPPSPPPPADVFPLSTPPPPPDCCTFPFAPPPPLLTQVWHLLRNGSGLCGELSALLASMAVFHGLRSSGLKVCFADSTAISAVPDPPEDAPPDSRGPGDDYQQPRVPSPALLL